MTRPTLIFVPGFWEGPTVFSKVTQVLTSAHNFPTKVIQLESTGTDGPNAKSFISDVLAVQHAVEDLVNKGREIVLVMHSAGGFIGSQAIQVLSLSQRRNEGKAGGVRKLVYLTAALFAEGSDHPLLPFFLTQGDRMHCRDPMSSLFNDIIVAEAEKYTKELSWQPATYVESVQISYGAWKEIPSVYLCCTEDRVIPLELQKGCIALAGAETESCDAGHMVILSQPERVVEFVRKAAGEDLDVEEKHKI